MTIQKFYAQRHKLPAFPSALIAAYDPTSSIIGINDRLNVMQEFTDISRRSDDSGDYMYGEFDLDSGELWLRASFSFGWTTLPGEGDTLEIFKDRRLVACLPAGVSIHTIEDESQKILLAIFINSCINAGGPGKLRSIQYLHELRRDMIMPLVEACLN